MTTCWQSGLWNIVVLKLSTQNYSYQELASLVGQDNWSGHQVDKATTKQLNMLQSLPGETISDHSFRIEFVAKQRFLTVFSIFDQQSKAYIWVFLCKGKKKYFKKDTNSIGMPKSVRLAQGKDGAGHKKK